MTGKLTEHIFIMINSKHAQNIQFIYVPLFELSQRHDLIIC